MKSKIKQNLKVSRNKEKKFMKVFKCITLCLLITNSLKSTVFYATDDPLTVVNNLSDFIFGLIRAIGIIILGISVMQIGLSFKSHDPSQRANAFLTLAGGIIITFSKEILKIITGG